MNFRDALFDELNKLAEESDGQRKKRLKRNYGAAGAAIGSLGGTVAGAMAGKKHRVLRGLLGGTVGGLTGRIIGRRVGANAASVASLGDKNYSLRKEQ